MRKPITLGPIRQSVTADKAEEALSRVPSAGPTTEEDNTNMANATTVNQDANVEDLPEDQDESNIQDRSVDELRDEAFEKVRTLGRNAILGEASLINLAETLVDGAMLGVFIIKPPQNDAKNAYEEFRNPDKNTRRQNAVKRIDTQSESSFNSNVKKLEWFINLGHAFKQDGQAKQLFNRAKDVHASMLADEQERKNLKLRAQYEAVLHVIRGFMMKQDAKTGRFPPFPSDTEMREMLRKDSPDHKDAIDALADALNALKRAEKGKEPNEKTADPGFPALKDALLTSAMKDITDLVEKLDNMFQGTGVKHRFTLATTPKKRPKKGEGNGAPAADADIPVEDDEMEDETEGE